MTLYIGQELAIPYNHCSVIVTELIEYKSVITARAKQVENTDLPDVFIRIVKGRYCFDNVREDFEDYLPSLEFDSVGDYFLTVIISFYGDLFRLQRLPIDVLILII